VQRIVINIKDQDYTGFTRGGALTKSERMTVSEMLVKSETSDLTRVGNPYNYIPTYTSTSIGWKRRYTSRNPCGLLAYLHKCHDSLTQPLTKATDLHLGFAAQKDIDLASVNIRPCAGRKSHRGHGKAVHDGVDEGEPVVRLVIGATPGDHVFWAQATPTRGCITTHDALRDRPPRVGRHFRDQSEQHRGIYCGMCAIFSEPLCDIPCRRCRLILGPPRRGSYVHA
jgi:hypothetical protein